MARRIKVEILNDLQRAQQAAAAIPVLQETAASLDQHKAELEQWESAGGWHKREVAAKNEAERLGREIKDAQNALLPALRELETSPLVKVIDSLYTICQLRDQVHAQCEAAMRAGYERALVEVKEEKGSLDFRETQSIATFYGPAAVDRMRNEIMGDAALLARVPPGRLRALGRLVSAFAFPPDRIDKPLDFNRR